MTRAASEADIQSAVIEHLKLRKKAGVFWFAIPNEGKRTASYAGKLKRMGMHKGCPDLCVLVDGSVFAIEFKVGRNDLSMAQVTTRDAWRAAGGVYEVARSLDEALAYLTQWDAIKSNVLHIAREVKFG